VDLLSAIQRSTDPYTWGFDGNGQLGNGGITNQLSPVQVSGLGPVAALAGGHHHQRDQPGAGGGGGSAMAGMTLDATGAWHNLAAFTTAKPQVTNYAYDRLYQLTGVRAPGRAAPWPG